MQDTGLSQFAQFLSDFWELYKKYYIPTNWEELITAIRSTSKKYNSKYFDSLLLTMLDDIERRERERIGKPFKDDMLKSTYELLMQRR